ncbi:hypothetical protein FF098_013030 [Parvularcula flava]|uniref:Uncharacterized protein n=1 Tax=Aquisalinus luteolus TaxID=1566827 RepID=A0A8J3ERP3_9PROT|nr:hypothetical protein [Aquisalinus luteolus]NHK28838.1 hypothetical protein [Aquisalinus luteolus]GGH99669.1 hypothetical protein GCM10011355_26170 [Aquisalinus luteolus]
MKSRALWYAGGIATGAVMTGLLLLPAFAQNARPSSAAAQEIDRLVQRIEALEAREAASLPGITASSNGNLVTVNAPDMLTLKSGKASIILRKSGDITIDGGALTIKTSGRINVNGGSDTVLKGNQIRDN